MSKLSTTVIGLIDKEKMFIPVLENIVGFVPIWDEFISDYEDDGQLPLHLALGDLSHYIRELIANSQEKELKTVFEIAEKWLKFGSQYVKNATIVSFFESLQNICSEKEIEKIEMLLLPVSKTEWNDLIDYWENMRRGK